MWELVNERFGLGAEVVSMSAIAPPPPAQFDEESGELCRAGRRRAGPGVNLVESYPNRGVVLVDEAHNFRNAGTRRYRRSSTTSGGANTRLCCSAPRRRTSAPRYLPPAPPLPGRPGPWAEPGAAATAGVLRGGQRGTPTGLSWRTGSATTSSGRLESRAPRAKRQPAAGATGATQCALCHDRAGAQPGVPAPAPQGYPGAIWRDIMVAGKPVRFPEPVWTT